MSDIELFYSEGLNFTAQRTLDSDEVELIRYHSSILMQFQRHHALIEYVIVNYNNLIDLFINKTTEVTHSAAEGIYYPFDNFYFEVNTVILNFLASSRTFLDHMESMTRSGLKTNQPESLKFDHLKSHEYDSKFSYRFLGKLRNYVTHCGMPPLSYDLNQNFNEEDSTTKTTLQVYFDRDELLSSSDTWSAKVRQDLKLQEAKFPAISLFNELIFSLIKIHVEYSKDFILPEAESAKNFILQAIGQEDGFTQNLYSLGKAVPDEENEGNIYLQLSTIPVSLTKKVNHIQYLISLLEQKGNEHFFQPHELKKLM